MDKLDTNEIKSLSTLSNDSDSANEIELEMMMQKPSYTEEDNADRETANEIELEVKMKNSSDTEEDNVDNEREPDRISNCDETQILTIENKEVSLEEGKLPTFKVTEDETLTAEGNRFQIIQQSLTLLEKPFLLSQKLYLLCKIYI